MCVAGVLAGGRSKRFGRPKALVELVGGITMIEHVVGVASAVAAEVVILGMLPDIPDKLKAVPILPDTVADRGPMGGLAAMLERAGSRWSLLLACDMPLLTPAVVERLLCTAERSPAVDAVAYTSDLDQNVFEACCALYHPRISETVVGLLRTGSTGLQGLLRRVNTHALTPTADERRALTDIDTVQDHDALGDLMA